MVAPSLIQSRQIWREAAAPQGGVRIYKERVRDRSGLGNEIQRRLPGLSNRRRQLFQDLSHIGLAGR
jgi:hypothetical protein